MRVRYLPRPIEGHVPKWFTHLQERGLFLTAASGDSDFTLPQKLASYRLAYWAFGPIEHAVVHYCGVGRLANKPAGTWAEPNFQMYGGIIAPAAFASYDAAHGLASQPPRKEQAKRCAARPRD